jgi:archaellum biogenesis ATPase FlaH
MSDRITILTADNGKRATKLWHSPDHIDTYDAGWAFQFRLTGEINGIRELSEVLTSLESDAQTFIVRATRKPLGETSSVTRPEKGKANVGNGKTRKWHEVFNEIPYHFILIDIDGFTPDDDIDPVLNPVEAIEQFVDRNLPDCFRGVSFHWQLSASAGSTKAKGVLKAHVWFWLREPYDSPTLAEWALRWPGIDKSLFNPQQIHYTASPLAAPGVEVPVPIRSGFAQGWFGDEVDLIIDQVTIGRAKVNKDRRTLRHELSDPKNKPGVIGMFHRVVSMDDLLDGPLSEHFERSAWDDVRLTWTGGNSPEGARITDDEEHIFITNNSAPDEFAGNTPLNKFDLLRVLVYGHLDDGFTDGLDDFEKMNLRPSCYPAWKATMDYINGLPEVQAERERQEKELRQQAEAENAPIDIDPDNPSGIGDGPWDHNENSAEFEVKPLPFHRLGSLLRLPPQEWLIKGVLPATGLGLLYGPSGAGKTFVAIDVAMHVARGVDWFGHRTKQAGVLYLAAEGTAGFAKRITAYQEHHQLNELDQLPFVAVGQAVDLVSSGHKALTVTARAARMRIGLVIIDTLNRSMVGDENNAEDMAGVIDHAAKLSKWLRCVVLVVHHSGKDMSRGARGHSSLRAAVDVELEVARDDPIRVVTLTKSRDGEDGLQFPVRLEVVGLGVDDDLEEITSCVAVRGDMSMAESRQPKPSGRWQQLVIQAFDDAIALDSPVLGAGVATTVPRTVVLSRVYAREDVKGDKRGKEYAARALRQLVENGVLTEVNGEIAYAT